MGFFDAFTGQTAAREIDRGRADSMDLLLRGQQTAEGMINADTDRAESLYQGVGSEVNRQYGENLSELNQSRNTALNYLNPYLTSGQGANQLYGDALGVNGAERQNAFGQNFAASDPFREQNAEMATNQLLKMMNARGMSRGGASLEAVARQSMARGSEDYNNYLSRLQGLQGTGQQAASQAAGISQTYGAQRADLSGNYTNQLSNLATNRANNFTQRGNTLGSLAYGNAQQGASVVTNQANAKAANSMTGINNLLRIGETAGRAYTAGQG